MVVGRKRIGYNIFVRRRTAIKTPFSGLLVTDDCQLLTPITALEGGSCLSCYHTFDCGATRHRKQHRNLPRVHPIHFDDTESPTLPAYYHLKASKSDFLEMCE